MIQKNSHSHSTHSQGKDIHHNWNNDPHNKLINQYGLHQVSNMHHQHHNNQNLNYLHGHQQNQGHFVGHNHNHNTIYNNQYPFSSQNQYHSLNAHPYQQSDFSGLNHVHHYHAQNIMGIGSGLPINAKYPG